MSEEFVPDEMAKLTQDRERRIFEIAKRVHPSDSAAIDMYAEEVATDVCRAAMRDLAGNLRRVGQENGEPYPEEGLRKIAEELMPKPEFYQDAVKDVRRMIIQAMKKLGKTC